MKCARHFQGEQQKKKKKKCLHKIPAVRDRCHEAPGIVKTVPRKKKKLMVARDNSSLR